jgi:NACHT domain
MDLLTDSIALGAFYGRYDGPKCDSSTRVAILEHIMTWIRDLQKLYFFMWLHGPAGSGKSAIAHTIAELCYEADILAASFFFSRSDRDESRLIPTLVYQLCSSIPAIRKYIQDTIERDPSVLSGSLEAQISSLMIDPLRRVLLDDKDAMSLRSSPIIIIIDGLDECGTAQVQRYVLSVFAIAVREIPIPISFLVTSRPAPAIVEAFAVEPLNSMTTRLALDATEDHDIKLFFESGFDKIKKSHPLAVFLPPTWPEESDLDRLVLKSSGLFIYASTIIKYISSPRHQPTDRLLDVIIEDSRFHSPFSALDALYMQIFSGVGNINIVLEILSLLLLTRTDMKITPHLLEDLFFLPDGDIYILLIDLHSIVKISDSASSVILLHSSLGDFLLDRLRSGRFHIDMGNAHANLTQHFLKHLSKKHASTSNGIIFQT